MAINIEEIGQQLREALNTDIAIIDKYGFILFSTLEDFGKGSLISPTILDFINARKQIAKEINIQEVDSVIICSQTHRYVFTFGKELILMSKVSDNIELNQFLPSIQRLVSMLDMGQKIEQNEEIIEINLSNIINAIESRNKELLESKTERFSIVKEIIKQISSL
ncbi:MAG: hypothetical protein ACTSRZ_16760 [Promethearchaeota archaeon]